MKSIRKNSQGIAHLALIFSLVLLVAIGGVGYYVVTKNKKPATSTTTSASKKPTDTTSCPDAKNDADLCAFLANVQGSLKSSYKATIYYTDNDGNKTTTYFDTDGNNNLSFVTKSGTKDIFGLVMLNGTSYIENAKTGMWSKFPGGYNKNTDPTSDVKLLNDVTTPENARLSYTKLGEEACGSETCLKYQIILPTSPSTETIVWFTKSDSTLRKWSVKTEDGLVSVAELIFTNVTISIPSPLQ